LRELSWRGKRELLRAGSVKDFGGGRKDVLHHLRAPKAKSNVRGKHWQEGGEVRSIAVSSTPADRA